MKTITVGSLLEALTELHESGIPLDTQVVIQFDADSYVMNYAMPGNDRVVEDVTQVLNGHLDSNGLFHEGPRTDARQQKAVCLLGE